MSARPRTASSGHSLPTTVRTPSRVGTASSAGRSFTGSELAALVQQRNALVSQLHRVDAALAHEAAVEARATRSAAPPAATSPPPLPGGLRTTKAAVRSDRAWVGGRAGAPVAPPRDESSALPGALQPGCHAFFPSRLPGAQHKRPTQARRVAMQPPPAPSVRRNPAGGQIQRGPIDGHGPLVRKLAGKIE